MMNQSAIYKQSINAYNQWKHLWRANATFHKDFEMKSLDDFEFNGVGKACVLVANGYTYEKNIETLKKHQDNVDIIACDKTIGSLIDNGITPDYCIVCDASVNYEKYLKPWKDKLSNTVLFSNVCGNTEWTNIDGWKDRYFFINRDVLKSEVEFEKLSGCPNAIPAGTNVSNAMIVFMTQSDNDGRKNFFGYDKILLIGFDYCWMPDGNYYAFDKYGDGKSNYMRHCYVRANNGEYAYTSSNLLFSAQWGQKYITTFGLPAIQCGEESILTGRHLGKLEDHITYRFKPMDSISVKRLDKDRKKKEDEIKLIKKELSRISKEHYYSYRATI